MTSARPRRRSAVESTTRRLLTLCLAGGIALLAAPVMADPSHAALPIASPASPASPASVGSSPAWTWPLAGPRTVTEPYREPVHEYGPGHRGIDVRAAGGEGAAVLAVDDGTVAFAGSVAGRGVITIDHGSGLVSTVEPVSPDVAAGARVARGDRIGAVARGGHTRVGSVHIGARRDGEYIDPLPLFELSPWSVLLPCCDG